MKINALKGMRDILPQEQRIRDYVQRKILEVYRASGFERISTPIVEDSENLDKSDGGDNLNLVFKIMKRGEKLEAALDSKDASQISDMGLRYDLTLPLTRFFAANHDSIQYPFKVIQTDRVYRAERPQKGRLREFVQCDIDILGDASANAEVELIDVTARAMKAIGFNDFTININDRRVLRDMLAGMGFAQETLDSVCITFDKLDKIGADGIEKELMEKNLPVDAVNALVSFVKDSSGLSLENVVSHCSNPSVADDLKYIISTVDKVSLGNYKVAYCPSLVRGQGYYTGPVFEIVCPQFSGAVGGGGRYDNLIGKFLGQQIPAVGFSIGFERICSILVEQGFSIPDQKERCAFLYDDSVPFDEILNFASSLRKDYFVSVIKKAKKAGPQFASLERLGYTKFASVKDGTLNIK